MVSSNLPHVNQKEIVEKLEEHDRILLGDGESPGVIHTVRQLDEDRRERKKFQKTILYGVIALLLEQSILLIRALLTQTP